jgi:selenocysteine-specific elongation factor
MLDEGGDVTLASFRDAVGCGRRNAQALLEYFDREGLTLRRGDVRVARRRRA